MASTQKNKVNPKDKVSYHHGDLYSSLLKIATKMLNEQGINSLSLRKIAENVGVSRTAAYHHFKDKNDLLCAIAAQGFNQWQKHAEKIFTDDSLSKEQQYRDFVYGYIHFATNNPNLYDLMFGRTIWKDHGSNETLRHAAFPSFDFQVKMTKHWQQMALLPSSESSLRLAQVIWGTLHGIAKLMIDGIYTDNSSVDEMCECAVNLFLSTAQSSSHS
ncbi:TetR/AcrR family transcriptional regulator [Thalassotalea castellviae]|uniref:TetR/AcrR family transcriptional regulator n=1 Tax=Thalassotalea castellviae TaxID=3075612 RepID=A0ABU3A3F7_9GAMM|nr:TetR/AcrR family transcriptional regulator [Thalassotalea sp. W431]MDT0604684.1 TetR/AcrR family transcriptional regulator [Thalassotalea sp. W431]